MSDPECPVGLECGNHPRTREGCTCDEYDLRNKPDVRAMRNSDKQPLPQPPPIPELDLPDPEPEATIETDPDVKRRDDGTTFRTRCSPRGYCFVIAQVSTLGPYSKGLVKLEYRDMATGELFRRLIVFKKLVNDGGVVLDFCPWCQAPLHFEWKDGEAVVTNAPQETT